MSAGTLALTNKSDAVTGAGTAFNTELSAGDFIVVTVGGVPYTLPVKSVESATALTLVSVFTGPTQSGSAWSAVPRIALNMVTAALVAQSAEALRGLNYDKQNWQQVFSAGGNITVTLPDGSSYNGPSWNSISSSLATQAKAITELSDDIAGKYSSEGGVINGDVIAYNVYPSTPTGNIHGWGITSRVSASGVGTADADFFIRHTVGGTSKAILKTTRVDGVNNEYSFDDSGYASGFKRIDLAPLSDGIFSGDIAFTPTAGSTCGMNASLPTFSDSAQRYVINFKSFVAHRKTTIYANGGVICQSGLNAVDPQMNSYFISWNNPGVGLYIDSSPMGSIQLTGSDERYKDVEGRERDGALFRIITVAEKALLAYSWKEGGSRRGKQPLMWGFSAQQLQKICEFYSTGDPDGDDMMQVEMMAIISDQCAAIRELSNIVDELRKQVASLAVN